MAMFGRRKVVYHLACICRPSINVVEAVNVMDGGRTALVMWIGIQIGPRCILQDDRTMSAKIPPLFSMHVLKSFGCTIGT